MKSEKYRKFLEQQAEKNPVKIEGSLSTERFKISWQNTKERPAARAAASDILDSLYLGREMEESVVVDRRVAFLLQDRLRGLEEENLRMHRRAKLLKLAVAGLVVVLIFASLALLSAYFRVQLLP